MSSDFTTTAIVLNLKSDDQYTHYLEARNALLDKSRKTALNRDEKIKLEQINSEFKTYRDKTRIKEAEDIASIRAVMKKYSAEGSMFLGGVNMIATDIIGFVKSDLVIYGTSLLIILMIILWVLFRRVLWVFVPIIICTVSVVATTGLLGFFDWEAVIDPAVAYRPCLNTLPENCTLEFYNNLAQKVYSRTEEVCPIVEEIIEQCPIGTCEVDCGSHICCYDNNGYPVQRIDK